MNTKISVIVLTKNSRKHIRTCIESILKQNYPELEILIIDAGSTDETIPILSEYKFKSSKPFRIIDAPNTTIGKARQIGLEESNGDILAYIDSDVELPHENWIRNMLKPFNNEKVGGTLTLAKNKDSDPEILKKIHSSFEYKNNVIDMDHYEIVGTSHILLRKSAVTEVGGFKDINFREDTDLTFKMMKAGYKFIYLPTEKCYHYHVDGYIDYLRKEIRNKKYGLKRELGLT